MKEVNNTLRLNELEVYNDIYSKTAKKAFKVSIWRKLFGRDLNLREKGFSNEELKRLMVLRASKKN
jgi:hypothetical protein